jgi:hypothetical protein
MKGIVHKEFVADQQSIPHATVTFYVDCVKMCQDFALIFGDKQLVVASRQRSEFFRKSNMTVVPHSPYVSVSQIESKTERLPCGQN